LLRENGFRRASRWKPLSDLLVPAEEDFGTTRQSSRIRSIAARVVKDFPAIISTCNRPFAISFRSPAMVIPPAGNAAFKATSNRSGASRAKSLFFGIKMKAPASKNFAARLSFFEYYSL